MRSQYRFPDGMRPATVQERYEFYHQEFRTNLVREWFRGWTTPIVFAVVIERHTKIFPVEYRRERSRTILIDEYEGLRDLRRYCMEFRPESVYYDRNIYRNWKQARRNQYGIEDLGKSIGQQLAFDIDPENFECPIHGTLGEKLSKRAGGTMRLIRLPHSLNGLVSRLAIPLDRIESRSLDLVSDPRCIPGFVRTQTR